MWEESRAGLTPYSRFRRGAEGRWMETEKWKKKTFVNREYFVLLQKVNLDVVKIDFVNDG